MAVLNAKQRRASATVRSGGKPKFPIPDRNHAEAALMDINKAKPPLTPSQRASVIRRARRVLGRGRRRKRG